MTARAAHEAVLRETRALVAAMPPLRDFVGPSLQDMPFTPLDACSLPVLGQLAGCAAGAAPETVALTTAIVAAAPYLRWQQTYSEAQVGAHYLANYGWFNLVSPEGPYLSDALRVSVGFWGQGLVYPRHRHEPEEIYCVLAGGARFETEGRAAIDATPATLIHYPPNIMHGMHMNKAALLAVAFWRGAALVAPSTLEGAA